MTCYRVLVTDYRGDHWTPVIVARDAEDVARKVENIYPSATIDESFVLHVEHSRWAIVFPDAPDHGGNVGGASIP